MKLQVQTQNDTLENIDIRELVKGRDYVVVSSQRMKLFITLYVTINDMTYTVPAGTVWNGASIPRAFWWLIGEPTRQEFALASLVHDFLYMYMVNRDTADAVFRKLLDWAGVNGRKVAVMWGAVRVGGHMFYASRAKNNRLSTRAWRKIVDFLYGE